MRAYAKGTFRVAASAALLSVMLGACSSVPDVVNPVKWYEQTTDFFSGDSQAADTGAPAGDANQGLAADPDAPAPAASAPNDQVAQASGGLSADQASGNYASEPIARQGAPRDVLTAQDTARVEQPPAPAPQPVAPVMAAPMPAPTTAPAPAPVAPAAVASAPPAAPQLTLKAPAAPKPLSTMTPPPSFAMPTQPANSMQPFGRDEFETVVIGGNGMETMSAPQPMQSLPGAPTTAMSGAPASGALFPQPGATTSAQAGPVSVGSMTRVATIHFANNSSNLDTRDRSILGAVVQLQKERGGHVVVVGHASSRTRDMDYIRHQMVNFEISMQRAATIGSALKGMGLTDEQLEVQAAADSQPLFLEVMPSGEAGNRRVEIYLAP